VEISNNKQKGKECVERKMNRRVYLMTSL